MQNAYKPQLLCMVTNSFNAELRDCTRPLNENTAAAQAQLPRPMVVPPDGFEPPTQGLGNLCSIP